MESVISELASELRAEHYLKHSKAWLSVRTDSMEPLITPGDRVLMVPSGAREICSGDIIVFKRNGSLIGHRVLKKQYAGDIVRFIEKGDSSILCGYFSRGDVVGRVIAVEGKNRLLVLSSPLCRFTGKVLAVWAYCASVIISRLNLSTNKVIRESGACLARISRLFSGILVRACRTLSYLPGLNNKRELKLNF